MAKYLDDYQVGLIERFGRYHVTREEVLQFARLYDPQPFHLDDAAAAQSLFGRIAASGWHTCAMAMRMMVDHWHEVGMQSLGSPGIDQIRWLRPVYPGDTLRVEAEWLEIRPSQKKPDRGTARVRTTVFNQDDVPVMQFEGLQMIGRRVA
jgi:acyl dehydratase